MANDRNSESVTRSSGNVFADLGLRDADEKQTKARLAVAIQQIIQARRLSKPQPPACWTSTSRRFLPWSTTASTVFPSSA